MDPKNAKISVLDLAMASPVVSSRCEWCTLQDQFGSDHYPISIHVMLDKSINNYNHLNVQPENEDTKWSFQNINWRLFSTECEKIFEKETRQIENPTELYSFFINSITDILQKINSPKRKRQRKPIPWWNKMCSDKIKERNKARRKLNRTISIENLNDFLKKKAEAQNFLRQTKRQY